MSIKYKDLIHTICKKTGVSEEDIKCVFSTFINIIEDAAICGDDVYITKFGKFSSDIKVPRELKNYLSSGKTVMTRGRVGIKFNQFDSRKKKLWDISPHSKAFKGDKKC